MIPMVSRLAAEPRAGDFALPAPIDQGRFAVLGTHEDHPADPSPRKERSCSPRPHDRVLRFIPPRVNVAGARELSQAAASWSTWQRPRPR